MFESIKTAWAALRAFKNFKWYAIAIVVVACLSVGVYAEFAALRSTISEMDRVISKKDQDLGEERTKNAVLQTSVTEAKKQRDDESRRYAQLDAENQKNKAEQEKVQYENAELAKKVAKLQKNDPGANASISDDVKRVHREAVIAFNAKYGSSGPIQAGNSASTNVPAAN